MPDAKDVNKERIERPLWATLIRIALPLVVLALGVLGARGLIAMRAKPATVERPQRFVRVNVVEAQRSRERVEIAALGTVVPRRELSLSPEVQGPVVAIHPNLIAGGWIDAGEQLFEIDPADYELAVARATAELARIRGELDVELGNAAVAAAEWELLEGELETTEAGRRLVLREPFVAQRRAALASAEADLAQAELNLADTRPTAPFDCVVISESVEIGQLLAVGSEAARLVDRTEFLVEASLPVSKLGWIELPGPGSDSEPAGKPGAAARVSLSSGAMAGSAAQAENVERAARVERLLPGVDREGRMARLQLAVEDPLDASLGMPLLLDSLARVTVEGRELDGVVVLPRVALRENDVLWVADDDDRLQFRDVEVIARIDAEVWIGNGIETGERVITSALSTPLPDLALSVSDESEAIDR